MGPKYSVPVRYGIIAALAMCILGFTVYFFYHTLFSSFWLMSIVGFLAFAIKLLIVILGGIELRRQLGGSISFATALTGLLIMYVLSDIGSSATAYVIPNLIDTEYPVIAMRQLQDKTRDYMEKKGVADEQIEQAMQRFKIEDFKPDFKHALKGFGFSLIVSIILSLIIAAFIRRGESHLPPNFEQGAAP